MELIPPTKQQVWKWPAVVNFTLGGMGTGFYLLGLLLGVQSGGVVQVALFKLLGPLLASLGFLALTTEAGRPMRGYNLFRHLRRSWMSRETLAATIFIPAAAADWLFPHPLLRALAAAGALALMISQGFIVYRARGVTAWNVSLMPPLFITSGFTTGSGLMLVLTLGRLHGSPGGVSLPLLSLAAVILNLAVWLLYVRTPDETFQRATGALRRQNALVLTVGLGHLLPALLLLIALPTSTAGATPLQSGAAVLAGLAILVGGASQKAGIILEAGYLRPIVLNMPRRQAGPLRP